MRRLVQFAHFSVKEYLTSGRLARAKDTISRFHVSMIPAHTIMSQACLGNLLHLNANITKDRLKDIPLAEYAAEHLVGHARFGNVSRKVQDGMKRLFDPSKSHLSVWVWIYDPEDSTPWRRLMGSERPSQAIATPLHYAAFYGMHDIATFLIVEHSQDVNARGFDYGETPLHVSSRHGDVQISLVLLRHGADIEARDDYNSTPLGKVAQGGHVELAHVLLEYGADVNAQDDEGRTPLYLALKAGHLAVAQVLLEYGADANAQDDRGRTPLYLALEAGHLAVAQVLLSYGADVMVRRFDNNWTLLHQAREEEEALLLLEHGANANALDNSNCTPLHRVSEIDCLGAARVLLEHGADANARDIRGATPLHLASDPELWLYERNHGYKDVIRLLLQYGSDIHARDDSGQTPFMKAKAKRYHEIMQLLLEHGAEDYSEW